MTLNNKKGDIMTSYDPTLTINDPTLIIQIPATILRAVVLRAEENGRDVHTEIAIRLARSLERDLEMIEQDNDMACKALDKLQNNPALAMQFLDMIQEK